MSEENNVESTENENEGGKKGGRRPQRAPRQEKKPAAQDGLNPDLEERVVAVNRVAKVVKGGRRLSFGALIVVVDNKCKLG